MSFKDHSKYHSDNGFTPEQQLMGTNIVEDAETDADYLASKLGFGCIGSSCCSPGMSYDETEKKCTIVEPFNNMLSNSYYSVS